METPPPAKVLEAFNCATMQATPVAGGQGTTFRAGRIALKPCHDPAEAQWLGEVLDTIAEDRFRLARPVRAIDGAFVAEGWCAFQWVEGQPALQGHWNEALDGIRAFHRALRGVRRPSLFDRRDNIYAHADRLAWQELPIDSAGAIGPDAERLLAMLRPVTTPSQLIHGDPSEGNLLFQQGVAPAVIDIAPYWHPPEFSVAMFVADAIAWSHAPLALLVRVHDVPEMGQLLARAVLFRLIVAKLFRGGDAGVAHRSNAYAPVIEAALQWS